MQKRGQINAYFIYAVLSILIVGATLLFGYAKLNKVTDTASKAEVLSLKSSVSNDVAELASSFGSVSQKTYTLPSKVKKVCVADTESIQNYHSISSGLATFYPLIKDQAEEQNNFFMIYDSGLIDAFDIGPVQVDGPGYVCYDNKEGSFPLKLQGEGDKAKVLETFEYTIAPGTKKDITVYEGVSVENPSGSPYPIVVRITPSSSGLSDTFSAETVDPNNPNSHPSRTVYVTFPVPHGLSCPQLVLHVGSQMISPDCQNNQAKFTIST